MPASITCLSAESGRDLDSLLPGSMQALDPRQTAVAGDNASPDCVCPMCATHRQRVIQRGLLIHVNAGWWVERNIAKVDMEGARMQISDICTRKVIHIIAAASVREAAQTMRKRHVGALVVVDQPNGERIPVGVVTDRDIVVAVVAEGIDAQTLTVGDLMSRNPATCGEDEGLFDAIQTMRKHGVRRLPVLNSKGGLAGIVTIDDIYCALSTHMSALSSAMSREQVHEMETRS